MPSASLAVPPGAIRSGLAGRNLRTWRSSPCAVRPSGILSGTVVPTVMFGQFQPSFPAEPRRMPRSSRPCWLTRGHPMRGYRARLLRLSMFGAREWRADYSTPIRGKGYLDKGGQGKDIAGVSYGNPSGYLAAGGWMPIENERKVL